MKEAVWNMRKVLRQLSIVAFIGCLLLAVNQLFGYFPEGTFLYDAYYAINLIVYPLLLVGLICTYFYSIQARTSKLGLFSFILAFLGTCFVIGDVWFENFVVPYLNELGVSREGEPPLSIMIGALLTFFTFASGWTLFGIHLLRQKTFPMWLTLLFIIGALLGQKVLTLPYIAVLSTVMMIIMYRISREFKHVNGEETSIVSS